MSDDSFEGLDCEHRIDTNVKQGKLPVYSKSCTIASEIANQHIPALRSNCEYCINHSKKPKSDNEAVRGLINHRLYEIQNTLLKI